MADLVERLTGTELAQLESLRELVQRRSGLSYSKGRLYQLANRVARRMNLLGLDDPAHYRLQLQSDGEEYETLLEDLLVQETSFFRNEPQFHVLREYVLPAIISRKGFADRRTLRLWSAGCAGGHEPYSLAMTAREVLGPRRDWELEVWATDLSRRAVERTAAGIYRRAELERIPAGLRERYLEPLGSDHGRLRESLRSVVRARRHNLLRPPPFDAPVDVIFCRNVLIYFEVDCIQRIAELLHRGLVEDGYLFIGHSESLFGISERFRLVDFAGLPLYRKSRRTRRRRGEGA
jgi:chemotaxis protein methyltransferase CheR